MRTPCTQTHQFLPNRPLVITTWVPPQRKISWPVAAGPLLPETGASRNEPPFLIGVWWRGNKKKRDRKMYYEREGKGCNRGGRGVKPCSCFLSHTVPITSMPLQSPPSTESTDQLAKSNTPMSTPRTSTQQQPPSLSVFILVDAYFSSHLGLDRGTHLRHALWGQSCAVHQRLAS
jgi:hypothetical protein